MKTYILLDKIVENNIEIATLTSLKLIHLKRKMVLSNYIIKYTNSNSIDEIKHTNSNSIDEIKQKNNYFVKRILGLTKNVDKQAIDKLKKNSKIRIKLSLNIKSFSVESFAFKIKPKVKRLSSEITVNINVKNLCQEIIEKADLYLKIEAEYKKGKFTFRSKNDRSHRFSGSSQKGHLIPIIQNDPYSSIASIRLNYNIYNELSNHSQNQIDSIDFDNDRYYEDSEKFNYYSAKHHFKENKNYAVYKEILDKHSDIWDISEVKKIKLNWELGEIIDNDDYKNIPNTKLFKALNVSAKIYLKTFNSNGFDNDTVLKTLDITNEWNNALVSKKHQN